MSTAMQIGMIIAMPFLIILFTFLYAGVLHLALKLFGGANQRFESTMRALCYVSGATGVFYLVPFCGAYVAFIWAIVALCIGLGRVHDTTAEKGVGATLVSTVVCCGAYLAAFGIFFATMMGSMGAFNIGR